MKITCRYIEDDGHLTTVEETSALAAWRDGRGRHWIDVESGDREATLEWFGGLGLDPATIQAIQAPDSTGRVMPFEGAIFFEYPIPGADGAAILAGTMALPGLVITLHRSGTLANDEKDIVDRLQIEEASTSGLVCAMALVQSLRLRRAALGLRDMARRMSETMDEDPAAISLQEILALKRRLLELDRVVDEQQAVFEVLQAMARLYLDLRSLHESFQLVLSNVRAADRRLERLDRAVADLQHRHESLQQDRINKRLGFLTIISAVFMPLTLIVGIYGMNFDNMPELHFEYGYFFALGGMVLIAGGLIWYFWTRKWLD